MPIPKDHPHWKRMRFKNNKVWVAADAEQNPLMENGKALIKYQLEQPHEYWVFPASLKPLDAAEPTTTRRAPRKPKTPSAPQGKEAPLSEEDMKKAIIIYTDGACSGNPGPAGIGVVMRYQEKRKEISRYIGQGTNNIAELEAIKAALLSIKKQNMPVIIFTDSSYALGLLTKGWKAKQNTTLVEEIRALASSFKHLRFVKVKGHAGDPDNERADRLAVQAITGK